MAKSSCAVMFVEVSGSTRLRKRLGDEIADRCVGECLSTVTQIIDASGGNVVKANGDGLTCRFEIANDAISVAQSAQHSIDALRPHGDTRMSIRVGIHYGQVSGNGSGLFGDAVNLAARMLGIAQGGEIVTTEDTVEKLSAALKSDAEKIDGTRVTIQSRVIDIYHLLWRPPVKPEREQISASTARMQLGLSYASIHCEVNSENPAIWIGRGRSCDLMVDVSEASREHAFCELRNGKFIIRDQSTNGTYIKLEGDEEIHLHAEEMELEGEGLISLGRPVTGSDTETLLYYRC